MIDHDVDEAVNLRISLGLSFRDETHHSHQKTHTHCALLVFPTYNHGCVHVTHKVIPKRKCGCIERAVYSEPGSIMFLIERPKPGTAA